MSDAASVETLVVRGARAPRRGAGGGASGKRHVGRAFGLAEGEEFRYARSGSGGGVGRLRDARVASLCGAATRGASSEMAAAAGSRQARAMHQREARGMGP